MQGKATAWTILFLFVFVMTYWKWVLAAFAAMVLLVLFVPDEIPWLTKPPFPKLAPAKPQPKDRADLFREL